MRSDRSNVSVMDRDVRLVFFFQAEDGIRDYKVTGVQTCALPISALRRLSTPMCRASLCSGSAHWYAERISSSTPTNCGMCGAISVQDSSRTPRKTRSEEHTSELQSPCNLVCRLLLEKKKRTLLSCFTTAETTHYSTDESSSGNSPVPAASRSTDSAAFPAPFTPPHCCRP